jgi:hypothetical protein
MKNESFGIERRGEGFLVYSLNVVIVETKVLKQLVRDVIQPQRDLGHSDRKGHKVEESQEVGNRADESEESAKVLNTDKTEGGGKENVIDRRGSAARFREVAEQACEDCQ